MTFARGILRAFVAAALAGVCGCGTSDTPDRQAQAGGAGGTGGASTTGGASQGGAGSAGDDAGLDDFDGASNAGGEGAGGTATTPPRTFDPNKVVCATDTSDPFNEWCQCARTGGYSDDPIELCNSSTFGGARCYGGSGVSCRCIRYACGQRITPGGPPSDTCACGSVLFIAEMEACPAEYLHYCYSPFTHVCTATNDPCPAGDEELPSCDASIVIPRIDADSTMDCAADVAFGPPDLGGGGSGGAPSTCKALLEPCDPFAGTTTAGDCCFGTAYSLYCSETNGCVARGGEPCTSDAQCFTGYCSNGFCAGRPVPCDPTACSGCQYFEGDACCYACENGACKQTCTF